MSWLDGERHRQGEPSGEERRRNLYLGGIIVSILFYLFALSRTTFHSTKSLISFFQIYGKKQIAWVDSNSKKEKLSFLSGKSQTRLEEIE